eukprot:4401397-Pyramimonas_sp.AAC.1
MGGEDARALEGHVNVLRTRLASESRQAWAEEARMQGVPLGRLSIFPGETTRYRYRYSPDLSRGAF